MLGNKSKKCHSRYFFSPSLLRPKGHYHPSSFSLFVFLSLRKSWTLHSSTASFSDLNIHGTFLFQLFMIDNCADDWRIAMTWQRMMQIGEESNIRYFIRDVTLSMATSYAHISLECWNTYILRRTEMLVYWKAIAWRLIPNEDVFHSLYLRCLIISCLCTFLCLYYSNKYLQAWSCLYAPSIPSRGGFTSCGPQSFLITGVRSGPSGFLWMSPSVYQCSLGNINQNQFS